MDGNRTRDWGIPQSSLSSAIINTEENPSSMATTSQTQSQTRPQKSISSASSTPHQSTSQNIEPAKEDEIAIPVTSIKKSDSVSRERPARKRTASPASTASIELVRQNAQLLEVLQRVVLSLETHNDLMRKLIETLDKNK